MGKISQADALTAARKIAEPISQKATEKEKELREYITELWKTTIPQEVMKMFDKYPNYISTLSSVNVRGVGIAKARNVAIIGSLPSDRGAWSVEFELNAQQSKKAVKLMDEKRDLDKKYTDTRDEIEQTILNLGTHKKVLDEFPEAYGALPGVNTTTALTVQIQPLRDKVKCLISPEKEKKCMEKIIKPLEMHYKIKDEI